MTVIPKTIVTAIHQAEQSRVETHDLYAVSPAAGFPAPGDDMVEKPLDLNDLLIDNPTATFFVRVEGDSMEGAKIFSGDILVVDRSVTPVDGSIVVAAVYGEMVVKRLLKKPTHTLLVSEHEGYEPIPITANDDCFVWGVVIGSARVL
jgi:DNA polymerase V